MTDFARTRATPRALINLVKARKHVKVSRWELLALVAVIALAATLRFWDLGSRAFHGDEAIHAGFAWQLVDGRGYVHNPLTHGPFQFLGTALVFVLFGDSDYMRACFPALFGTAPGSPSVLPPRLPRPERRARDLAPAGDLTNASLLQPLCP